MPKNSKPPLAAQVGFHGTISADVYRRARVLAIQDGVFVKDWVEQAVIERVEREEKKAAK
jgi:hypothetical protein